MAKEAAERAHARERAWKIGQLAASLAKGTEFRFDKDPTAQNLNVHNRQAELIRLVEDAVFVLNMSEIKANVVDAYTLFPTDDWFTASRIAWVFRQHEWTGLTDDSSVRKLFDEILKHLRQLDKYHRGFRAKKSQTAQISNRNIWTTHLKSIPRSSIQFDPLWESPDNLKKAAIRMRKGAPQKLMHYRAKRILLLAHYHGPENVRVRIRRDLS